MQNSPIQAASNAWGSATILNASGNPMQSQQQPQPLQNPLQSGPSGPSGGDPMIEIAGLQKNVGFLNWVAGLATVAIVALYFVLTAQIDTRFDKIDMKVSDVSKAVGDLRVDIVTQNADIKTALEKQNVSAESGSRKQ